jgi:hypothetical protein
MSRKTKWKRNIRHSKEQEHKMPSIFYDIAKRKREYVKLMSCELLKKNRKQEYDQGLIDACNRVITMFSREMAIVPVLGDFGYSLRPHNRMAGAYDTLSVRDLAV